MSERTCVSLFSGIGGLDHGLHRAGFRHLAFCESDAYRRDVLAARWPRVLVFDDVAGFCAGDDGSWPPGIGARRRALGGSERGTAADGSLSGTAHVDLLCGGFPCQDLSVAGQRRGLMHKGGRSNLFFEFARVAESLRPRWVLVENVPGLLSSNGGRDFGVVLGTLADVGYGLAWRVLDSRFFGVPQRRRRVFIVGALAVGDPRAAAERAGEVLAVGARCQGHPATRGEKGQDVAGALGDGAGERGWAQDTERMTFVPTLGRALTKNERYDGDTETFIATPFSHASNPNSNAAGRRREDDENLVTAFDWQAGAPASDNEQSGGKGRKWNVRAGDYTGSLGESRRDAVAIGSASVRRLMPVECERLQALPDHWTDLGGTADSKRYAALGDAVTASVAEWIGTRLMVAS